MPEISFEISVSLVAWYGAIVATVAVFVNGFLAWRDQARIVVTARGGYKVTPGGPYDSAEDHIIITVANQGRHPRSIEKVGLKLKSAGAKKHLLMGDPLHSGPEELTEGRSSIWVMLEPDNGLEDIEYAWALDQTGKEYRANLKED